METETTVRHLIVQVDEDGELEVDYAGMGYYEALGVLVEAQSVMQHDDGDEDDD